MSCGGTCPADCTAGYNTITCAPSCSTSYDICGVGCPEGYTATGTACVSACLTTCGASGNATECRRL